MNQFEAMVTTLLVGFSAVMLISFFPRDILLFSSRRAKIYLGQGVGILLLNLWPFLFGGVLANYDGAPLYPTLAYFTIAGFSIYFFMALRAERHR